MRAVCYVGPFDAVDVQWGYQSFHAPRRELIDVPDELAAQLLQQAVWADADYDLHDADAADIVDWVDQDHGLAQVALAEEMLRAKPRALVVDHCRAVLGVAASPEDIGVDVDHVAQLIADATAHLGVPEPVHELKPRSIRKSQAHAATDHDSAPSKAKRRVRKAAPAAPVMPPESPTPPPADAGASSETPEV